MKLRSIVDIPTDNTRQCNGYCVNIHKRKGEDIKSNHDNPQTSNNNHLKLSIDSFS